MMRLWLIILLVIVFLGLFFVYAAWYPAAQVFGNVIYKSNPSHIYLTFDDGPGPSTITILDLLQKYNISATFFSTGVHAAEHPDIILRIIADGHALGTHSYTHPLLFKHNQKELGTGQAILENISNQSITLFRPPYGFRIPATMRVAKQLGLRVVTWNIFPRDYASTADKIIGRVCNRLKPGAIIVLHDGPIDRPETIASIEPIITCAQQQGYTFGTLS